MIIIAAQSNAAEKQSEAYPMNTPLVKWAQAFPESAPPPPDPTVSECMAEIMRLNALVEQLKTLSTPNEDACK